MNNKTVTLDVREDLRNGREPFSKIMSTVAALRSDEQFLLIAPFQPVPLFELLKQRGFSHDARLIEAGNWEVLFTRDTLNPSANRESPAVSGAAKSPTETMEVDVRGLEPPQPLVVI